MTKGSKMLNNKREGNPNKIKCKQKHLKIRFIFFLLQSSWNKIIVFEADIYSA